MTVDQAVELARQAVMLGLLIGAPVMAAAIVVSLLINIVQAATQLHDQTLSFVPKIVAMMATLLFVLPWLMEELVGYSRELFHNIPKGL